MSYSCETMSVLNRIPSHLKRKIICNIGPTNSGKTHAAMEHLSRSTGVFCSPLRMLAHESYEKLKKQNCKVNLITGEVRIENYNHRSVHQICSTIEMLNIEKTYQVAVIDEIQMIENEFRGQSWTRALMNLKAETLYACGEERAAPIIERLIKTYTDDDIEIRHFERLSPLTIMTKEIAIYDLQKGDCIVCFSRNKVVQFKNMIEQKGLKVSVVYGALPPESRVEQSNLFNTGKTDVLIGTDAIGMGLNLEIQRMIFSTNLKYNGSFNEPIEDFMVRQIAGRAGRFSSANKVGFVSAFDKSVLSFVNQNYHKKPLDIQNVIVGFELDDLKEIKLKNPTFTLTQLISYYFNQPLPASFAYQNTNNLLRVGYLLNSLVNCSIRDQYYFLLAPVKLKKQTTLSLLLYNHIIDCFIKNKFADPFKFLTSYFAINGTQFFNSKDIWRIYEDFITKSVREDFSVLPLQPLDTPKKQLHGNLIESILTLKKVKFEHSEQLEHIYMCLSLYAWLRNRFYFHPTFNYAFNPTSSEVMDSVLKDSLITFSSLCSKALSAKAPKPKRYWSSIN